MIATIAHDLFRIGEPIVEKAIRTAAVYGGILLLLRIAGKRDLAQLNSFDLVVLLLLSNVVQNAVIGNDDSLAGGLLGAAILILINSAVVRVVRRSRAATRLFEGTSTMLIHDGELQEGALRRLGLRREDVMTAVLRQGASSIDEVREAMLEPGGAIVVKFREGAQNATKADVERVEAKVDRALELLVGAKA